MWSIWRDYFFFLVHVAYPSNWDKRLSRCYIAVNNLYWNKNIYVEFSFKKWIDMEKEFLKINKYGYHPMIYCNHIINQLGGNCDKINVTLTHAVQLQSSPSPSPSPIPYQFCDLWLIFHQKRKEKKRKKLKKQIKKICYLWTFASCMLLLSHSFSHVGDYVRPCMHAINTSTKTKEALSLSLSHIWGAPEVMEFVLVWKVSNLF